MTPILDNLSPESLTLAIEANRVEQLLNIGAWKRAAISDAPELVMVITDVPIPILNIVTRVRLSLENLDANIEKAIERFKEKGNPFNWHVGPATTPSDIGSALLSHGFKPPEIEPGMAIDLQALKDLSLPKGLVVEPVRSVVQLDRYVQVGLRGFGMPDFLKDILLDFVKSAGLGTESSTQNYLGTLNGEPVGISSVFYGAGVAGIYRVATVSEARGKGVGSAMTIRPLMDARTKGYRAGILQSSEMGNSVYEKIGFREYCRLNIFTWSPG